MRHPFYLNSNNHDSSKYTYVAIIDFEFVNDNSNNVFPIDDLFDFVDMACFTHPTKYIFLKVEI